MLASHDRFEALSGAIALGEATPGEREAFDAHAAGCARCRADAEGAVPLLALLQDARLTERWRPSIAAGLVRRIREARRARARWTIGALGWCVALSLAVDVAFGSGFAGRLTRAFEARSEVAAVAAVAAAPPRRRAPAALALRRRQLVAPIQAPAPERVVAHSRPPAAAPAADAAAEVPDVLAGLDLYGKVRPAAKNVAFEKQAAEKR